MMRWPHSSSGASMSDIVERLRLEAPSYVLIGEAAIEIERLREREHSLEYSLSMILDDLDATAKIGYIPHELLGDHIYITARKLLVKENGNET